ncbi:MAG: B12-binding domain-containing radical SAM protein [Elusimicrobia bacterium]|nr:B12-binding domain-containing radical SAM protein [Elusimicrobiota bacterium]
MDLLIINPRIMWFSSKSLIANGPLTLASYLHEKGFDVRVIDDNTMYRKYSLSDFADYINSHQVKIVGFSASALNAYNCYELAKNLRKIFPEKLFIAGGLHSYDCSEEMTDQCFDIVFKSEAELSLEKFLAATAEYPQAITNKILNDSSFVSKIEKIPGMLLNRNGRIFDTGTPESIMDLDILPFNNYDLVNLGDYIKSKYDHHAVTNQILFQRGCPYNCTFCKSSVIPSKIRSNSPRYMMKQLRDRYNKFGLSNFFITDSNFTIDKKRFKEFHGLLTSSELSGKINFMIQTSVTISISDDEIEMLKDIGVTMYLIGVERFNDESRKLIKKAGTNEQVTTLIKKLNGHGVKTIVNILVNFSFETKEFIDSEAKYIEENLPYVSFIYINYLSPMPGTQVYINDLDDNSKKWYLIKDVVNYRLTYYDLAYLVEGPVALDLNIFRLPRETIARIRRFKEKYQWKGSLRISRSPFLKMLIISDMLLGKISYYTAKISPLLEHIIFKPFKFFRLKGYKMFFNLFIAKHK